MNTLLAITVCVILFFSCNSKSTSENVNPQPGTIQFDKKWAAAFIDSVNKVFAKEVASGDSVALANQYWPDATLLLDYSEPVTGNAIAGAWGEAIRMGLKEMTFTTTDITGSAAFIIETGIYEMKSAPTTLIDKGKYVVVWQKRGNDWKLYRDIGATSMRPAK